MRERAGWAALVGVGMVATLAVTAGALAQTTSSTRDTALPPMSGPPVDVPMHMPQPPRDPETPATPQAQAAPAPPRITPPSARLPTRPSPPAVAAQPHGGTITPIAPRCRDATYRVIIDGRPELARARLCRMADGTWRFAP